MKCKFRSPAGRTLGKRAMLSTRRSLAWSFSQEIAEKAIQFVGSIVIARLLTPDEVGVFSIAMAANFLIATFRDFGVGTYLVREPTLDADKIRTAFSLTIIIQWSLGLLLIAIREPLATLYDQPGIASVLLLVAATFFIGPFGQPAGALLRREMRFDILHHITIAAAVAGVATTIALAAYGFSYMALAWGMVTGSFLRSILLLSVKRDHLGLRPGLAHWRKVVQFGGWLTGAALLGTSAIEGRKFILGGFLGVGAVALLDRAQQIPRISRQALFLPISRVILSTFSKNVREGVSIGPAVALLVAAQTAIIWPAFLSVGFLSVPVILILFGENWRVAGELLPYILVGAALVAVLPQPEQILVPRGHVKRLAAIRLVQAIVVAVLAVIGAMHSLELFISLVPLSAAIFITMLFVTMRKFLEVPLKDLLGHYLQSLVISVCCAAPALAVFLEYGEDPPVPFTLGALALAGLIWLCVIFLMAHPLSKEISTVFVWFRGRLLRRASS